MFQNLRGGSPFYILYKNEPKLSVGEVQSVSTPLPQFSTSYQNGILTPPKSVVDVKVTVEGKEVELQKLPADVVIADFGNAGMVVSESREAIQSEIEAFKNNSVRALGEVDHHKAVVSECDKMLAVLNPQLAKEAEQAQEIEYLKGEMSDIKEMLSKVLGLSEKKEN